MGGVGLNCCWLAMSVRVFSGPKGERSTPARGGKVIGDCEGRSWVVGDTCGGRGLGDGAPTGCGRG